MKQKIFTTLLVSALLVPSASSAQETTIRDITFPVDGEYTYSDTFGVPRSGGRTHEGIDILADKMTPLVSAVDGRVRYVTFNERSWGMAVTIEDSDGYTYHYLHINNDTPGTDDGEGGALYAFPPTIVRGAKVFKGQLVGWVGDSGNAETTVSHLHFEIRKNGEAINPYASLVAAEYGGVTTSETPSYFFTKNLELYDKDPEVLELQKYLNRAGFTVASSGPGSIGNETDYFGPATQSALIKFQKSKGISPASGYFGPLTRAVVNANPNPTDTTGAGLQPGWLVKNQAYAEVFYVDENYVLHWIINEEAAQRRFGDTWNQDIKEYEDLNQFSLTFGENYT